MLSDTNESSYTMPFIMPCFYYKDMEKDPTIVIKLYNHIKNNYDNFRKHKDDNAPLGRKLEQEQASLEDNFSNFGFFVIFYFCLKQSDVISSNKDIKQFFENEIYKISNDAIGVPIEDIKAEIKKLLDKKNLNKDLDISNMRFYSTNEEVDDKDIKWYYISYINCVCPKSLRNINSKYINRKTIKIKKIFFVSSPLFYEDFELHKKIGISEKDIKYFHIDEKLKFDNYSHKGCNCSMPDCISMIEFFKSIK